ncbi:DUF6446 family protein [Roseobacteraceae bacterium S113]
MAGKLIGGGIVALALIAGAVLYYLQVYAFYDEVAETGAGDVALTLLGTDQPEAILYDDFKAIDSESSPIRYRACFTTPESHALLTETYESYAPAIPRTGPSWFDCYDAEAIAGELDAGTALAFLGEKNIRYGVDRVVVITDDGRGYVWHTLNRCTDPLASEEAKAQDCPDEAQN